MYIELNLPKSILYLIYRKKIVSLEKEIEVLRNSNIKLNK